MIPQDILERVLAKAQETASHSWEYSTVFEALLEYRNPQYSVFHPDPFPNGEIPKLKLEDVDALRYIQPHIRTDSTTLSEGNGSSADPASLLPAALLLFHSPSLPPSTRITYHTALTHQLSTLLTQTPRFPNGALSHRSAYASLWSDSIYMVPPILAYHAVHTASLPLARESIHQCTLYHAILCMGSGLWRHIVNAPDMPASPRVKSDEGAWSTANAWVAAGMCRVLATLAHSRFAHDMRAERDSLCEMVKGVLDAVMKGDTHSMGLLRNYLDDGEAFGEVAGTALMGAAAFRFAVLLMRHEGGEVGAGAGAERYAVWANEKMEVVARHVDGQTGIVHPVVDSLRESREMGVGEVNPEAQAFVVLLWAAWRDWEEIVGSS